MSQYDISPFLKLLKHPVKGRMFLFTKLPSAFFAGVRIVHCSPDRCVVKVPYKWFSQNPFRSTYFACLAMAAEMSTGVLAMANIYGRKPAVSMLIVKMEMAYLKKATGITWFECNDGLDIAEAVHRTVESEEPVTCRARSVGKNSANEIVAECFFEWSFKRKRTTENG